MAYRQSTVDEGKIARLQKEGRGLGRGAEYKPWLMIYDLPSKALSLDNRIGRKESGRPKERKERIRKTG